MMKTHCKSGHEFTNENTYVRRDGRRICRACERIRAQMDRGARRSVEKWTDEKVSELYRLVGEGKTHHEIAAILGVSLSRVQGRIYRDSLTEEQRKAQTDKKREWERRASGAKPRDCREYQRASYIAASRPSAELIAEANRRAAAPRDLTAIIFNDPPKGYSALDRRQSV